MEERLKKFTRLIDAGTYTAAAQVLHTSQPALTTAIQKLSREMRADLFTSNTRNLELTPAGKIAYEHGQQLIIAQMNLQSELRSLEDKKQPFRLGSIDGIADMLVKAELFNVLERDSELSLQVQSSQNLLSELKKSRIDMAILVEQPNLSAGLNQRPLGNERFILVCSSKQEAVCKETLKQGILTDFLAYNLTSTTYQIINSQLLVNGYQQEPRLYSSNPSILLQLVLQGKGITALPVSLIDSYIGTELVELELKKPLFRPILALWQAGHKLPDSIEDFLDAAQIQLI